MEDDGGGDSFSAGAAETSVTSGTEPLAILSISMAEKIGASSQRDAPPAPTTMAAAARIGIPPRFAPERAENPRVWKNRPRRSVALAAREAEANIADGKRG